MATDTADIGAMGAAATNAADNIFMAFKTRRFRHFEIAIGNPNLLWEQPGSECPGVKKSVQNLGEVFRYEPRRRMAIVADRHFPVTRFAPAVQLLLHDMTIGAGLGIVG